MTILGIKLYLSWDKARGPPGNDGMDLRCRGLLCQTHSQTTYLNSRSKMEESYEEDFDDSGSFDQPMQRRRGHRIRLFLL